MDPRVREANRVKQEERQALLNRAYERVIGSQLEKFKKKKVTTGKFFCTKHGLSIFI